MKLEFWFEFASTYSYPAAMRIEDCARRAGVDIAWRAFLLGPVFKAQGWTDSPFNLFRAKGQYMWRDLERLGEELGIPFRRPSQFPRSGLLASRVTCELGESPCVPSFVREVYRANFEHDLDIGQRAVIADCLRAVGQEPETVIARAEAGDSKLRLRARTEHAIARGIFGAPTFIVEDELFWGNDRMEQALAWAVRRRPEASPAR